MNVLVTGAAGYIGSAIARGLIDAGHQVRATDRVSPPTLSFPLVVADLLDRDQCGPLVQGMEAVVHLANHANANQGLPETVFTENVAMNMNLFQAAASSSVRTLLFASSVQTINGDRDYHFYSGEPLPPSQLTYLPIDGDSPPNPKNPYSLSKTVTERMLQYFVEKHANLCAVAIRFPAVINIDRYNFKGARDPWGLADEGFSYLDLRDAVSLIQALLGAKLEGFRTYMPAARTPRVAWPLSRLIATFFPNVPLRCERAAMSGLVDISRITADTGWVPKHEFPAVEESAPNAYTGPERRKVRSQIPIAGQSPSARAARKSVRRAG